MKEDVIIEVFNEETPDRVCVNLFDSNEKTISFSLGVMDKDMVLEEYNVVGQIINGDLTLFGDDYYEDEFINDEEE